MNRSLYMAFVLFLSAIVMTGAWAGSALPKGLRMDWPASRTSVDKDLVPQHYLRSLVSTSGTARLLELISANHDYRIKLDGDDTYQQKRLESILARARAVRELAKAKPMLVDLTATLEKQVRERSLHKDWLYHGLDGTWAVRALVQMNAIGSVPVLIETLKRVDPELAEVGFGTNPTGWADWRIKSDIMEALGKLPCRQSKAFLLSYLKMDEGQVKEMCIPMHAEAAKSLMKQELTVGEIESLLKSPQSQVRGEALLYCIDHPTKERTEAINKLAPWALELPSASKDPLVERE